MISGRSQNNRNRHPLIIAHRGAASRYPENTIAAFEAAIRMGADGIECDVRLSADGAPVVIHDATLERTTNGSGKVCRLTARQLKLLDAGEGEKIPTLEETVELCKDRALLCIEFKDVKSVRPSLDKLKILEPENLILCSFKPRALRICAELQPDIRTLLITGSRNPNPIVRWRETFPIHAIRRVRASGLSSHHKMLNPKRVEQVRKANLGLVVWSSLEEETKPPQWFESALEFNPDALVTTWPDRLADLLKPTS